MSLYRHSIDVIKRGQAENGAFLASPNFSTYAYSWLRDGTFIAYAMDVVGEHETAAHFYRWVHQAISHHRHKIDRLLEKKRLGITPEPDDFLHTRYTVDGQEGTEPWGNFQLDGYGAYLWGVAEHLKRSGNSTFFSEVGTSVRATAEYLLAYWYMPNFDCWEEHGDDLHPSTLAAICGGLQALADLAPEAMTDLVPRIRHTCQAIRDRVELHGVAQGHFCKSFGVEAVDANLLWLSVPFGMFALDDERMVRTVQKIEQDLVTGGVHRYRNDSFYGGGAWILLTAWLGWYYVQAGNRERAEELQTWVEAQADAHGDLPEQVAEGLLQPHAYDRWLRDWGEPARPLLWSHAMYLVLKKHLSQS